MPDTNIAGLTTYVTLLSDEHDIVIIIHKHSYELKWMQQPLTELGGSTFAA